MCIMECCINECDVFVLVHKRVPVTPSLAFDGHGAASSRYTGVRTVQMETGDTKLMRAQGSLNQAKLQAQNTLAPILERMAHAKKLKNAESVLHRLSATLEYPHNMKQALLKGEYESVLATYKCLKAHPALSSQKMTEESGTVTSPSLRIIQRVKKNAYDVVIELKTICLREMCAPDQSYDAVVRYLSLLYEIEDDVSTSREHMRQCFNEQLKSFVNVVVGSYDKFKNESVQAFMKGQEMNLITKVRQSSSEEVTNGRRRSSVNGGAISSSENTDPDEGGFANKNTKEQADIFVRSLQISRHSLASRRPGNNALATVMSMARGGRTSSSSIRSRTASVTSTEPADLEDEDSDNGDEGYDDENGLNSTFEGSNWEESDEDIGESDEEDEREMSSSGDFDRKARRNSTEKKGRLRSDRGQKRKSRQRRFTLDGQNNLVASNYCVSFCGLVRILFVQRVVDAIDRCIPHLHRYLFLLYLFIFVMFYGGHVY